jgi:hypothetical protein
MSVIAARGGQILTQGFPMWVRILGWVSVTLTAIVEGYAIWIMTTITWEHGPQLVGGAVIHGPVALLTLALLPFEIWVFALGAAVVVGLMKRLRVPRRTLVDFGIAVVVAVTFSIPYGAWMRLFADRLAVSPHAGRFMEYAARTGDWRTVRALLSRNVPVDSTGDDGRTALHGAAMTNQVEVIEVLVSSGGRVDALDDLGNSPLEVALMNGATEAAELLRRKGAHRIRAPGRR